MSNPYRPARLPSRAGHTEHIKVEAVDIDNGCPCSSEDCAAARAIARHFERLYPGTQWSVSINERSALVMECDTGTDTWTYTHNARAFIEAFDALGAVPTAEKPGPFALELYA